MESDFARILLECAQEAGFPLAGALDLHLAQESVAPHIERYDRWIKEGRAGAMQYLERGRDRRSDPQVVFPEAKSILCVALPYPKRPGGSVDARAGSTLCPIH